MFTEGLIVEALRRHYPKHYLSVTPAAIADLLAFAQSNDEVSVFQFVRPPVYVPVIIDTGSVKSQGWVIYCIDDIQTTYTQHGDASDAVKERIFRPPQRRYNDETGGAFVERVVFASYDYIYKGSKYLLYVVVGNEGPYSTVTYNYILAEPSKATSKVTAQAQVDQLIKAATTWGLELHNEVLVFDQGYWQPNQELWQNIQKASWEDVILDQEKKDTIIDDVTGFFDAEDRYAEFNVPWKRGVIFHGPPGVSCVIQSFLIQKTLATDPMGRVW